MNDDDDFKVVVQESLDSSQPDLNMIHLHDEPFLRLKDLDDCREVCDVLNIYYNKIKKIEKENKELKASLYAEKTNIAEVVNDYAKQFKRYSAQFSFMMDLAEDLGIDVRKLEALDD